MAMGKVKAQTITIPEEQAGAVQRPDTAVIRIYSGESCETDQDELLLIHAVCQSVDRHVAGKREKVIATYRMVAGPSRQPSSEM